MSALTDKLLLLTKQLYPNGRAWKMPFNGVMERLHKALIISEAQAYTDAESIHDCILPDNANFTTQDAYDWETRFGLIHNESLSLADRMLAIKRKLNQPGLAPAKSNWRYLQKQLRDAGFDVYVHENIFLPGPVTKTPFELTGDSTFTVAVQHGDFQMGDYQHGGVYTKFVANHIDEATDWRYDLTNLRKTFYIGGVNAGDFANVDSTRKNEFRQLILTIKPTHTVGFLLINYV